MPGDDDHDHEDEDDEDDDDDEDDQFLNLERVALTWYRQRGVRIVQNRWRASNFRHPDVVQDRNVARTIRCLVFGLMD